VSNQVENYLTAFNEADSLAGNLKRIAASIARVAAALEAGKMADMPEVWPNREQLRNLVAEVEQAKDRARQLWVDVPADMKPRLPQPDHAGSAEPAARAFRPSD